jgi:hypothetical protein
VDQAQDLDLSLKSSNEKGMISGVKKFLEVNIRL